MARFRIYKRSTSLFGRDGPICGMSSTSSHKPIDIVTKSISVSNKAMSDVHASVSEMRLACRPNARIILPVNKRDIVRVLLSSIYEAKIE